jgi:hypothetical protein
MSTNNFSNKKHFAEQTQTTQNTITTSLLKQYINQSRVLPQPERS